MSIARGLGSLPVFLAQQLGFYEKHGLAVSIEDVSSSTTKTTQALLGGSVDIALGVFEQTLSTAMQGQIITSFITLMRGDFRALLVAPAQSSKIQTVEDLKGAVVGVSALGSPNQFLVTSIASRHGVSPKDLSIVAVGVFTLAVAALERNKVDAAVLSGGAGGCVPDLREMVQSISFQESLVRTRIRAAEDFILLDAETETGLRRSDAEN